MEHCVNTEIRLLVLIPAAVICVVIAFLGLGFGGLNVKSMMLTIVVAGTPLALIAWTISDHRKRDQSGR